MRDARLEAEAELVRATVTEGKDALRQQVVGWSIRKQTSASDSPSGGRHERFSAELSERKEDPCYCATRAGCRTSCCYRHLQRHTRGTGTYLSVGGRFFSGTTS